MNIIAPLLVMAMNLGGEEEVHFTELEGVTSTKLP